MTMTDVIIEQIDFDNANMADKDNIRKVLDDVLSHMKTPDNPGIIKDIEMFITTIDMVQMDKNQTVRLSKYGLIQWMKSLIRRLSVN